MVSGPRSLHCRRLPFLVAALLLSAVVPLHATVSTVYTCPSSGHSGNHDSIFNGFFVQNVNASNLHSVVIPYTTDFDGLYTLTLTARRGTYTGTQVGTTQTQTVSLSSSADTLVTWNFGDAPITAGDTLTFTHTENGPGGVQFNLQPTLCTGDVESVGTSGVNNGFSVAVTITQNSSSGTACIPTSEILCIDDQPGDHRFRLTTHFSTVQAGNRSGNGQAISLSSLGVNQGGLFWFFDPTNPEMLIKVIKGCSINNHFWVFYAAGTNVGFTVTVTDTTTGHQVTYTNHDLTAAPPVQDTNALSCP